jgi:hypothetical protein
MSPIDPPFFKSNAHCAHTTKIGQHISVTRLFYLQARYAAAASAACSILHFAFGHDADGHRLLAADIISSF